MSDNELENKNTETEIKTEKSGSRRYVIGLSVLLTLLLFTTIALWQLYTANQENAKSMQDLEHNSTMSAANALEYEEQLTALKETNQKLENKIEKLVRENEKQVIALNETNQKLAEDNAILQKRLDDMSATQTTATANIEKQNAECSEYYQIKKALIPSCDVKVPNVPNQMVAIPSAPDAPKTL